MDKKELYSDIKILIDKFCRENLKSNSAQYDNDEYNFKHLCNKYSKIKIPIIQRDYAQGRNDKSSKYIREEFLRNIREVLKVDGKKLNLDFIYGNTNANNEFEPLDGQQRLTTLFLIYTYLYKKKKKENADCKFLKKFTYETRISSKDFFEALVENLEVPKECVSLKEHIKNSIWFLSCWIMNPTVNACLNTLEDIHQIFYEINNLDSLDNITFKLLDIGTLNLSDDLYIKMNSRGKELTEFENLKAQIIDWIKNNNIELEKSFEKIDTEWSEFLWKKIQPKNNNLPKEIVDELHVKIIIAAVLKSVTQFVITRNEPCFGLKYVHNFLNKITKSYSVNEKRFTDKIIFDIFKNKKFTLIFKDVFEAFKGNEDINHEKINQDFTKSQVVEKTVKNIIKIYNYIKCYGDTISKILSKNENKLNYEYKNNTGHLTNITDLILFSEASYPDYIMFYAMIFYLEAIDNNTLDEKDFIDWIRFIRNMTALEYFSGSQVKLHSEGYIRDQRFIKPFEILNKILSYKGYKQPFEKYFNNDIKNISDKDTDDDENKNRFENFIKYESKKAEYIKNNPAGGEVIHQLENNMLLKGNLKFIFDKFIDNGEHIDLKKLACVLDKCFDEKMVSDDFRMAFVTVDDKAYDFIKNHHNCYTFNDDWQHVTKYRLFENYTDIRWCINITNNDDIRENFKKFFDKLIRYSDRTEPYEEMIKNFKENHCGKDWRYKFIELMQDKNISHVPYIVVYSQENEFHMSLLRIARPVNPENDFYEIV